jgi:hypothetical protein
MLHDRDPIKASGVREAMLQMHRIDRKRFKQAYEQG